jgi:hypothetical protein
VVLSFFKTLDDNRHSNTKLYNMYANDSLTDNKENMGVSYARNGQAQNKQCGTCVSLVPSATVSLFSSIFIFPVFSRFLSLLFYVLFHFFLRKNYKLFCVSLL